MPGEDLPAPSEGVVLTHHPTASGVDRSRDFYTEVLGSQVVLERTPAMIEVANAWIIINEGGRAVPGTAHLLLRNIKIDASGSTATGTPKPAITTWVRL